MSRIHSLQSSTTSHKLLKSVRSLRPLLCEALRASGCDTIDINEQDQSLQNEDVQHHDIYAKCLHAKELTNLHSISSYGGHIHDHDVNAEYHGHIHIDQQVQHRNLAPHSHNSANDGDPFVDVQHYHDAHNHGHPCKAFEHHCDALHHGYGHHGEAHHHGHVQHGDAHHHGHGLDHGYYSNSIIVSTDNLARIMDYCSELPGVQEEIVQMSSWHSFPMTRESSVNVDPHTPLSCTQYPQADYHLLDHQHSHAYDNGHLQQHISSENTPFLNTVLLEAPAEGTDNKEGGKLSSPKGKAGTDNEEGGKLSSPKGKASIPTANLFSERRRRRKWNEALYALRALVPTVSKMDKLSIVGDTLTYLHQLKDKVDNLQNDICSLQAEKEHSAPSQEGFSTCTSQEMETGKDSAKHKILQLDVRVVDMEQKTYHICIRCERENLLKLSKALDALNFNMLNANIVVTNENQILYTVVVKVDIVEVLTSDMLKESILKSATMHGFHL